MAETERSYPFSSGPGEFVTEDDWAAMTVPWQDNGVFGAPGTNALKVEKGSTSGKIKINPGDAQIDGYHYRLVAAKEIDAVANGGTSTRTDLVALYLDRTAKTITPVLLTGSTVEAAGPGYVPLGEWLQPKAADVTAEFWGSAVDRRWFMGARVRPAVNGSIPPAVAGAFMYQPAVGSAEAGTVFLGDLNSEGEPYWRAWEPWANERIDPKEVEGNSTVSTTSTSYVTGSTAVATTFVAPPSGKVYVTVTAQCEAVAPTSAYCSFEIRVNNSSGAVFLAASDDRSAAVQEDNWSTPTRRKLVTGLTAGTTYYIRTMIRSSNSANTATFFQRSLLIEPVYTDVSPGRPSDSAIVGASVLTAGGSIIRIPNGDTGTSALRIQLPAGDRADAPDTMAFYVNTGTDASPVWSKTGWYNEYGEFRVQPSASTRTPAKVRRVAGQTADLFHIEDENQNALAGFHADGTLFAPNLTGGAVGSVSADSTVTGAPAAPLIRHNRNYAVASGDQNLLEFKVQGVTTSWLDPFGMYRAISPTATDTPVRVRRHASQTSNLVEVQNAAGTQVHWAVDKDGFTVQGNGTAAPVKMAPVLVLATGAPVPAGTPAGTVILRS